MSSVEKPCRIWRMMAGAWGTFSSGIPAMEATCSCIVFHIHMRKRMISCSASIASPDDARDAMHPALTSYPGVLVVIHMSSMPASIALGISTLSRDLGVARITFCRTFSLFSLAYWAPHGMIWKSSREGCFLFFRTCHLFFLKLFYRARGARSGDRFI